MIHRQVNHWTSALIGYDGWPYGEIPVKVVGWAVADASQILDRQPDEIVYTDYIFDDLSRTDPRIPEKLPIAPSELSRFENFRNPNYSYPGGLDKRFDMYLWATESFGGGAGGDWGQRQSDDYILSTLDLDQVTIVAHELGHGFGLPDFYQDHECPPGGFPLPTIMWAGNSSTIDRRYPVYGNWPETGVQWVQYTFDQHYTIVQSDVYWFKDNLGIDVPNSYRILYLNRGQWEEVGGPVGLGTK
nr:hypothetical protein [Evansella caseinilytica]